MTHYFVLPALLDKIVKRHRPCQFPEYIIKRDFHAIKRDFHAGFKYNYNAFYRSTLAGFSSNRMCG